MQCYEIKYERFSQPAPKQTVESIMLHLKILTGKDFDRQFILDKIKEKNQATKRNSMIK